MRKYVGSLVAVSLLALSGCATYPYGGYYGGYPYSGYPYSAPQTAAPYSYGYGYGYPYDPYGSSYGGNGYGYSAGAVVPVPVPAPPVVVTGPSTGVAVDQGSDPWASQKNRYLARERWRNRHSGNPDSSVAGDQPTNPGSTPPGSGSPNPGDSGQIARDWRRERFGNRAPQTGEANSGNGGIDKTQRPGFGSTPSSASAYSGWGQRTWQAGRNGGPPIQSRIQATPQMRANVGGTGVSPQMRPSPVLRQPGGSPAATPRMSPAPSPRLMTAPQSVSRPQASQVRPQAGPSGVTAGDTRQRPR